MLPIVDNLSKEFLLPLGFVSSMVRRSKRTVQGDVSFPLRLENRGGELLGSW